jgi:predicted MFS family arabinose efflux permease
MGPCPPSGSVVVIQMPLAPSQTTPVGAMLVVRFRPTLQPQLIVPLAAVTGVPLLATVLALPEPIAAALSTCSGAASSYLVLAQIRLTHGVPDAVRDRAIGVASAGLQTAQGIGVLLSGTAAELVAPSTAIALCAAAGCVGALFIGLASRIGAELPTTASEVPSKIES